MHDKQNSRKDKSSASDKIKNAYGAPSSKKKHTHKHKPTVILY